jgi:hypothetical protein
MYSIMVTKTNRPIPDILILVAALTVSSGLNLA